MARVPVFLFVICSVYKDDLLTNTIKTQTELYFYSSLMFIRNHFKSKPNQYPNLMSIIEDRKVIEMLYSIMQLSVTTYMENKVVFDESDIRSLGCRFPIEQTGFITKYRIRNEQKATYQFRHLVLHEFFTALHLCVTKDIEPFKSNRELSSCKPTIVGVQRMLETRDNTLFVTFYDKLVEVCKSKLSWFSKPSQRKALTFNEFVGTFLQLPSKMIKDGNVLYISQDQSGGVIEDFLRLYSESSGGNIISPELKSAEIKIWGFRLQNVVNLIKQLKIREIKKLEIWLVSFDEGVLYLASLALCSNRSYDTEIYFNSKRNGFKWIRISQGSFHLEGDRRFLNNIPDEWLEKSTTFAIILRKDLLETEGDEKAAMDFLGRITSYQKPITLKWKMLLKFRRRTPTLMIKTHEVYNDEKIVQNLLEKHHIDTTNIHIRTENIS
eukprot:TCONS_00030411-protein